MSMPDTEKPKFTADGALIPFSPDVFREWVWVGEPLTQNELSPPAANFPEFHNVYINRRGRLTGYSHTVYPTLFEKEGPFKKYPKESYLHEGK